MTEAVQSEAAAGAAPLPASVGELLSRARCSLGLSADDVAQQLKFKVRQIEALEAGRFAELPAGIYVRGMVRSYARLVKLEPEGLLERVPDDPGAPSPVIEGVPFRKPIPFSDSARRVNLGYSLLSAAALAVIAAVAIEWPGEEGAGAGLQFVPATRIGAEAAPAAIAAVTPLASASAPLAVAIASPGPVSPPPVAAASAESRIVLEFGKTAWVEVRDRDGRVLLSRLNSAGTTRAVEGAPPLRLVIGNAQHVKLSYGERAVDLAPYTRLDVARLTLQ